MSITFTSANAAVSGPSISETSNFQITWTNNAQNCGSYKYYIQEFKNASYITTYYVYDYYQNYYNMSGKNAGLYTYKVYYSKCTASGSIYPLSGSKDVQVLSTADANRDIIFIHTDLLGTPVAESDIKGDLN